MIQAPAGTLAHTRRIHVAVIKALVNAREGPSFGATTKAASNAFDWDVFDAGLIPSDLTPIAWRDSNTALRGRADRSRL